MTEPATTDEKPPADGEEPAAKDKPAAETSSAEAAASGDAPADQATEPAADTPGTDAATSDAPVKKKKKKKKRKAAEAPKEELDAEGRERPTFVLSFPSDPALDHAVKAFELGDYAAVRAEATALAEHPSKEVRAAAGELLRRIAPDPLVKVLLAMAVMLLFVVTFWAYRSHGVH
jgi:hypothetical protein